MFRQFSASSVRVIPDVSAGEREDLCNRGPHKRSAAIHVGVGYVPISPRVFLASSGIHLILVAPTALQRWILVLQRVPFTTDPTNRP
eukprot:1502569-Prymnesium_polylepis.1